jgi:phage-related minor tail protein
MTESVDIEIAVDTKNAREALAQAEISARGFASALSSAFTGVALKGKDLGTVLEQLAQRLATLALNAALKPLESGFSSLLSGALGGLGFASGGVVAGGEVKPFARGGVVAASTYFPLSASGQTGLMGEKGAEAILPLARGADGTLGVRANDGVQRSSVTVNISTPDAASFRRSDAYLSGLVARAVARGQRGA